MQKGSNESVSFIDNMFDSPSKTNMVSRLQKLKKKKMKSTSKTSVEPLSLAKWIPFQIGPESRKPTADGV